jgi:hypothetical protein
MLRYIAPLMCCAGLAHADTPPVTTYALVVGSNAAGPGQTALKYAEDDARRVGAILGELGGVSPSNVDIVLQPSPQKLRESIDKLTQRVAADNAAGKQSRIFFYYSGHARATAVDLGPQGFPLAELRQRLLAVPATLTVVVLDACQSGAFSRVKGATPAADFSFNSRQQLDATGVAVLASSSGSELSQESEQLKSSYFTHHLLVGMRGAGDANSDGIVSVDEAYRYAYHQTLLATASTAVGGQHVSLEVDLKGHGEVALAFPRAATRSTLPAALEGQALVHDKRSKTVVAETYKAKGAPTRIAVAPGEYEVMVRQGTLMRRCQVSTVGNESSVDLERCSTEAIVTAAKKGGGFERPWHLEVMGTMGSERRDATPRRSNFGYKASSIRRAGLASRSRGITRSSGSAPTARGCTHRAGRARPTRCRCASTGTRRRCSRLSRACTCWPTKVCGRASASTRSSVRASRSAARSCSIKTTRRTATLTSVLHSRRARAFTSAAPATTGRSRAC